MIWVRVVNVWCRVVLRQARKISSGPSESAVHRACKHLRLLSLCVIMKRLSPLVELNCSRQRVSKLATIITSIETRCWTIRLFLWAQMIFRSDIWVEPRTEGKLQSSETAFHWVITRAYIAVLDKFLSIYILLNSLPFAFNFNLNWLVEVNLPTKAKIALPLPFQINAASDQVRFSWVCRVYLCPCF